jgi:hypothetical protein
MFGQIGSNKEKTQKVLLIFLSFRLDSPPELSVHFLRFAPSIAGSMGAFFSWYGPILRRMESSRPIA